MKNLLTSSAVKGLREELANALSSIEASVGIEPEADTSTESRIEAITEAVAEIQGTARDALAKAAELQKEAKGHAEALKAEFDKGKAEAEQAAEERIATAEAAAKEKADADLENTVANRTAAQLLETMGAIGNPPVKVDENQQTDTRSLQERIAAETDPSKRISLIREHKDEIRKNL